MKCINDEGLILYIDGALDSSEEERTNRHLSRCTPCLLRLQVLQRQMQQVIREMDKLEPPEVPDIPAETIARAARRRGSSPQKETALPIGTRTISPTLMKAAGFVLVVMAAFYFMLFRGPHPDTNETAGEDNRNQFVIHSVKMEEKPAQAIIIQEKEENISIVWVEKM